MEVLHRQLLQLKGLFRSIERSRTIDVASQQSLQLIHQIKSIGFVPEMGEYQKRKLGIFNLLNFLQLLTGVAVPVAGMMHSEQLPSTAWLVACLPTIISMAALYLNHQRQYQLSLLVYFILYPFFTCVVYINGFNLGVGLSFILYGVLAVFFLRDIEYMLFTIAMSMMSYFILCVVLKNFRYHLEIINKPLYLFNQLLTLGFIFYGLYLVKKENTGFQRSILQKNRMLQRKTLEIQRQKEEIDEKASLLKRQTEELSELNAVKNKLFSVVAHDLRSPMYGLRNLFKNAQQYNATAEEVKGMVPDVINDLNYTIGLMENLLQWAKAQMQAHEVQLQSMNVSAVIAEVVQLQRHQAEAKRITLLNVAQEPVTIVADKEMISLVLRNLLSNAIKFTPSGGRIEVGISEYPGFAEVYVQDSGMGISAEALQKINQNNYYTTRGTDSESGTGLGIMLCREFLAKNGGQLFIESELGAGSTFSFTLPQPDALQREADVRSKKSVR